ncbi:hypothetical protein [Lewinella sp. IMCC34183]|uniref:hypothetical protein n=1 Tax=Lewinella sp. IMCC34183 TaxID=2248762 RepID=UPI000E25DEFC|nr:hypothetical protein [Lewinella sp. IMCC34183]
MRFALLLVLCTAVLTGQDSLSVNPTHILRDVRSVPLGLNLNTFTDDDANRPKRAGTLAEAVSAGGFRALRFPGGEKSDVYAWAAPPYDDPATSGLLRTGPDDWPANDSRFWDRAAGTWSANNYNFDDFIADCRATGAEPIIVVAFDGMYKPAGAGGTALSREQALDMAVKWVEYANVTHDYGIRYWTLGNETWNGTTYAGDNPGFTTYGRDAAEFARAMKAVDPDILVGINGHTTNDFRLALAECADDVDWLDVHTYPAYGFRTYADYRDGNLDPRRAVDRAQDAIDELPDADVRDKLFIMMTEVSAYAFDQNNPWDSGNNLGQALANFDIMGQMLEDDRVTQTLFWNSRWIDPDVAGHLPTDLFTDLNELNASGTALSLLTRELLDETVATVSSARVRTFATRREDNSALTIFLVNKDTDDRPVVLSLDNYFAPPQAEHLVLAGTDPTATEVAITEEDPVSFRASTANLTLPATSITVLRFVPTFAPTTALPVTLLEFRGTVTTTHNLLHWTVAGEADLAGYQVERSTDGREWSLLATVTPNGGPTYAYRDPASATCHYRLRMVERDGSSRLSEVIVLEREGPAHGVFPNPTPGRVNLPREYRGRSYTILTEAGRAVASGRIPANDRLTLPDEEAGVYYVLVDGGARYRIVKY